MVLIACIVGAFLIGSIPIGFLVARARGIDIRTAGSGNIGATNVMRVLGVAVGLTVFLLDVLKGLLPAVAGFFLFRHSQVDSFVLGLGAVAGHCLSPFLQFRGGKGVATGLGALAGSCPLVAACALGIFLIVLAMSRYVSLASILAALSLPFFGLLFKVEQPLLWALAGLGLFVIYRHRANIGRLLQGTENRFSLKPPSPAFPSREADRSASS